MLRKVAILVVSVGLTMSPLSVQALGFSEIQLKSSFDEKLSAEVDILSENVSDVKSLTIKLATEEVSFRNGIERTALHNKIKFKVKQRANGDYYIDVTTSETVRELFMNFLVEFNWKNGRMFREYTVLINLPSRMPIQARAPVMVGTITPEAEKFNPESAFIDDDPDELWPRIPLTAYRESSEDIFDEDTRSSSVAESFVEMGDLYYGIVKAGDNLRNIAEKLRQGNERVSVHQVMMALLKNNPNAFVDNNIHRLKVGHVLRIDNPSALTAMSRKEAMNAYTEQTGAWNNYRQQTAKNAGIRPIVTSNNVVADDVARTETAGELTLVAPKIESLTAEDDAYKESLYNELSTVQDQLRQTKLDSDTMRTRNIDLNNKLKSIKDEINRLQ